jgi:ATP-dependent exoDNAse (exonuclease V) beta subunit
LPGRAEHRTLQAVAGAPPGRVEVRLLRSSAEEASYVAAVLRAAHLDDELPWSRMAVLVRSTATTLAMLRRALIAAGVPVAVPGWDVPLAEQPAVAHLLTALRCVLRPDQLTEDVAEHLLLGPIGHADALLLRRLRRELRSFGDGALGPALLDLPGASALPERVGRPVQRVARVLAAGRNASDAAASPEDVLWAIWNATGLAHAWETASLAGGPVGAAADRDLDSVIELFEAAARFTDRLPGASAERFLEHLAAQQIPGDPRAPSATRSEAVQVLTAHASKGLEWDLVCVAHVQEGVWPDLRRRGTLLGSELLVDIMAGRDGAGVAGLAPQIAEERRLFYVAITRARRRLVVTAVSGDDEQPSRFLDELDPIDGERPYAAPPRGVHLPGLVAELRAVVCHPTASPTERAAAAGELARLARAGVPGAHPDEWWALAPLSDDGPVAEPTRPVTVSPSRIESYLRCELRALLAQLGARDDDQIGASLGTLIHEVAALAPAEVSLAELEQLVDERWHTLDFGASWLAAHERERATTMLAKLVEWLRGTRGELERVDVERDFDVVVGDARLRGRVDRLERDAAGRAVVIDFKTGKSKADDPVGNPQLGAYQLAVEAGGFGDGTHAGGARLVQIGTTHKAVIEQVQPPLAEADDPDWIAERVAYVAGRLRGSRFSATLNSYCGACDVKSSCPLTPEGRQVTT